MCDVHRQYHTRFWMECLGIVDKIPNMVLKKRQNHLIRNNEMHLFIGSCIKINFYLIKSLAHGEFFFPFRNSTGLKFV